MKCKYLLIYILAAFMLLSLFGCADVSGDGNSTDLPGSGDQSGEITTDAVTEAGTEADAGQTEQGAAAPSAAVVDLLEITYYWYKEDGEKKYPEVSDLAIKALEEYFAGCGSVKVTGLLMTKETNEENKSVPHHYTYDVEADGRKYTLKMTLDNEITIAPYRYDDLIAESEEGLIPVRPSSEAIGAWWNTLREFTLNGHKWTFGSSGELLCNGENVGKSASIKYLYLADVDGNGTEEIISIYSLTPETTNYTVGVYDPISDTMMQYIPSVHAASKRIREASGSITYGARKELSVSKNGELLLVDYWDSSLPKEERATADVYKIMYDPSSGHVRLYHVRSFPLDTMGINPDDERITG